MSGRSRNNEKSLKTVGFFNRVDGTVSGLAGVLPAPPSLFKVHL